MKSSLSNIPLKIDYTLESHREGLATYFRAYLQEFMKKWIKENPKSNGDFFNIYRDGFKKYIPQLILVYNQLQRSQFQNI